MKKPRPCDRTASPYGAPGPQRNDQPASAVLRSVRVLMCLAESGGPRTVTKVARTLGLPISTTHRILNVLKAANYVAQDDGSRYSIGPSFMRSASTLAAPVTLHNGVQRVQQKLVEGSGESAYYAAYLPAAGRLRFTATLQSHRAIRYVMRSDTDHSLLWGASGLSIASALPEPEVHAIFLRERHTGEGEFALPGWDGLLETLREVRRRGYALSEGQRSAGAHAIAAPVFANPGLVVGCIGLSMPAGRSYAGATARHADLGRAAAADLTLVAAMAFESQRRGMPGDCFSQLTG